ncbi:MAG: aldose epimerase family protein [Bacillota bacterium]
MNIEKKYFGRLPGGEDVYEYELSNSSGFKVKVLNYGGIITEILAPDSKGIHENVVLGFDNLDIYIDNPAYFGAIVGRTSGRISNATFQLNGKRYDLHPNDRGNNLHGGEKCFSRIVWAAKEFLSEKAAGIVMCYRSPDMEEGFPGNLDVEVTYTIDEQNSLSIDYKCSSDKDTLVNLTNHSYFNLSGNVKRSALTQKLQINASKYINVDPYIIPIEVQSVEDSPFDLRKPRVLEESIDFENVQLRHGKGYDHPFILDGSPAAILCDEISGRQLVIETTEPCIVFYSGGYIGSKLMFKEGVRSKDFDGICLETQWYTDCMNNNFPKRILKTGEVFESRTTYKFSIKNDL